MVTILFYKNYEKVSPVYCVEVFFNAFALALASGALTTIAISSSEIALSLSVVQGISIQNQIKGRICTLIPAENGILVQIDCGNIWMAGISLKACRDMNLREGGPYLLPC